ncbi:Lipase 1-like protein [Cladobotryum mycophilum]|uniref:Lipase 1-like protein n=1 Tax=Cladobotryum mycophilum TaxID=491253 RepID=A0ABR0SAE7_9HYPO
MQHSLAVAASALLISLWNLSPPVVSAVTLPKTVDVDVWRQYHQQSQYPQSILGPRPGMTESSPSTLKPAGFIALGDSYSAGIGTGLFNGTEDDCRHGVHAYPMLIYNDVANISDADSDTPALQFLSCTGSTINDMLAGAQHSQIDQLNTSINVDFALLSIGGNDLGFFEIMNSCIFRFYNFYSGTCETALRNADQQMAGPEFENRLRLVIMEILDRVRWEKHPSFTITITGYARFFNADTEDCDDYSLGIWWRGPKLTRELRRQMNEMVIAVNDKIRTSVDSMNAAFTEPRVLFIDYDDAFDGHRFCEAGVIEPDYLRNETWFFLVGGIDNGLDISPSILETRHAVPLPPTSSLVDPEVCLEPSRRSGDWGERALCMMAMAASKDPSLRTADGEVVAQNTMWYVPTYYGKTFHPRTLGHMAIRDRVYQRWQEVHNSQKQRP